MTVFKRFLKSIAQWIGKIFAKTAFERYILYLIKEAAMDKARSIQHQEVELTFGVPNNINHFSSRAFFF